MDGGRMLNSIFKSIVIGFSVMAVFFLPFAIFPEITIWFWIVIMVLVSSWMFGEVFKGVKEEFWGGSK